VFLEMLQRTGVVKRSLRLGVLGTLPKNVLLVQLV